MMNVDWLKKDEQVADVLRSLIGSGEWEGHLPGYRKLEKRLKVNRTTIERAMERLVGEGLLASAEPGKRRAILKSKKRKKNQEKQNLLIVGPRSLNDFSPAQRAILTGVFPLAESEGWKVVYEFFDFSFPRKSVSNLKQLLRDYRPSRVILMLANTSLAQWATKAEIPCFALGGEVANERDQIDGMAVSFNQLVCDACALLHAKGHRRILIPIVSGKEVLRNGAIDASLQSWASGIPRVEVEAMFVEQGEWLPDVMKGFWPKAFARQKPTAVLVKETHEYLSLLSYCHQRGIRIPEDLSVIQLSSDTACSWLDPSPDRFEFPVEKICRRTLHWLQQPPAKPQGFEAVPALYVRGGTLAKAKG